MIDSWLLLLQDLHQNLAYESYCLRRHQELLMSASAGVQ